MLPQLNADKTQLDPLLTAVVTTAHEFFDQLPARQVGVTPPTDFDPLPLPHTGLGAAAALTTFKSRYEPWLSGSVGARYFGFVTGGVTPAALVGDWLTSVYDQNATGSTETCAPQIELDTLSMLRDLFGLPPAYVGSFVTGATMSNFVGLALARQWFGQQHGVNVAQQGLWGLPPLKVFSSTPHSSTYKALAMLGLGRAAIHLIPCLPQREAIDIHLLEQALAEHGQPSIVVANAGTVNTVDFDDLQAISALKQRYPFWLHVDAAFGGFAACSPHYRHYVQGLEQADSITIDAHKWLNVPYDAAMQFSRHPSLQMEIFQNAAAYLNPTFNPSNFVNLTPENSRRLRALASWFSLMAYGAQGYTEIVEWNCQLAQWLGEQINSSSQFELLAPVRLNGICFTLQQSDLSLTVIQAYLTRLKQNGVIFLTPTVYDNIPAIRLSVTNWRTTHDDMVMAWQALQEAV